MHIEFKQLFFQPIVSKGLCFAFLLFILWQIIHGLAVIRSDGVMSARQPEENAVLNLNEIKKLTQENLKKPLFGAYVPVHLSETEIKPSRLNITVVGLILSQDESESKVMIRDQDGQDHLYRQADSLPGGFQIKRITAKGVLVEREGELERLSLPKNELIFERNDTL